MYFLKLGTIGFGGPVALVGYMHKDLVENRQWISEEEYKEALPWHSWLRDLGPRNWEFIRDLFFL